MTASIPIWGSAASDWPAARTHPHTYPGDCPPGSFAIVDGVVSELTTAGGGISSLAVVSPDGPSPVDALLAERGLAPIADRIPVIAYGGNRCPGTIALKSQHYEHSRRSGQDVNLLLRATMRGVDVVAGGLSDQGYLYADLYAGPEVADTAVDVRVMLLDDEGLRVMNDSEGLRAGIYGFARFDGLEIDGSPDPLAAFAYVGGIPAFVSPDSGTPLAFEAVAARGRVFPALLPPEMLSAAITSMGSTDQVRELMAIDGAEHLGEQVMRHLNGQFWFRRHTGLRRAENVERLEQIIWAGLLAHSGLPPTTEVMASRGALIEVETAYDPPATLRVGSLWKNR